MGVSGLWQLLEPVGRRVELSALTSRVVAVDASIWMIQFLRGMRDERGDPVGYAHLMGFFRRICRLLYHRIRPVFIFDGDAPALKKKTTAARRARRDQHDAAYRRAAEKLLMTRLKQATVRQARERRNTAAKNTANSTFLLQNQDPADLSGTGTGDPGTGDPGTGDPGPGTGAGADVGVGVGVDLGVGVRDEDDEKDEEEGGRAEGHVGGGRREKR